MRSWGSGCTKKLVGSFDRRDRLWGKERYGDGNVFYTAKRTTPRPTKEKKTKEEDAIRPTQKLFR